MALVDVVKKTYVDSQDKKVGLPIVVGIADRTAQFPAPAVNQRVHNLASGAIERWTGSTWELDFVISSELEARLARLEAISLPPVLDTEVALVELPSYVIALSTAPSSGVTGAEPVFNPAVDITLLEDNFDAYATLNDALTAPPHFSASTLNVTLSAAGAGRGGGASRCIHINYDENSEGGHIEGPFGRTELEIAGTYYYRTSVGADPTWGGINGSGFKWFMVSRPTNYRQTWGVGLLDQNAPGNGWPVIVNPGNAFSTHDNTAPYGHPWDISAEGAMPNPTLQNVANVPRFGTTNDGAWHRWSFRARTGPTGFEMIWVDGVLILDTRVETTGITVNRSQEGFNMIQLPGLSVANAPVGQSMTVDIDDFHAWAPR